MTTAENGGGLSPIADYEGTECCTCLPLPDGVNEACPTHGCETQCQNCGSRNTWYDSANGWCCGKCHATDADE